MNWFLLFINWVASTLFECENSCIEIEDSLGWITPAPHDLALDSQLETQTSESNLLACGVSLSKNLWDQSGITGAQIKYCDVFDPSITETFETEKYSSDSAENLECDSG